MVPANYVSISSYICKKQFSISAMVAIIIVSTIVVFSFVVIFMIVFGFFLTKITKKILYWLQRDKAEKDMEKRLLENEIVYTDEECVVSEEYRSVNKSVYIIGLDQITLDKKIGEGMWSFILLVIDRVYIYMLDIHSFHRWMWRCVQRKVASSYCCCEMS